MNALHDGAAPGRRLSPDGDAIGRLRAVLGRKSVELLERGTPPMRAVERRFAEGAVCEFFAPPVRVSQKEDPAHGQGFHLVLLLKGFGHYRCADGGFTQETGDIVLIDRARDCEVVSPVGTHVVRWSLPRSVLGPLLSGVRPTAARRIRASNGTGRVLARHARELAREAGNIPLVAQSELLHQLCRLVGLAFSERILPDPPSTRAGRMELRRRVLAHVEAHLREPDLSARRVAQELGVSERWLHAVMRECVTSFSDHVARRRIEQSLHVLEGSPEAAESIAEVAFMVGFEDLSTFYRRFRRYMRTTPGQWRARRARDGARRSAAPPAE